MTIREARLTGMDKEGYLGRVAFFLVVVTF